MDVDVQKGAFPRLRCSFLRRCVLDRSRPSSCGMERSRTASCGMDRARPVSVHAVTSSSLHNIPIQRIDENIGLSTLSLVTFATSPKRKNKSSSSSLVGESTPGPGHLSLDGSSLPLCIPAPQYSPLATLRRNRRRYTKKAETQASCESLNSLTGSRRSLDVDAASKSNLSLRSWNSFMRRSCEDNSAKGLQTVPDPFYTRVPGSLFIPDPFYIRIPSILFIPDSKATYERVS